MRLHYESYGEGAPVVILHGLLGSSENWLTMSKRFVARFRVLALDQRNHGRSPHSEQMDYTTMAEDVVELLDVEGLESAAIIGHSMGGKTGMQLALLHPQRVQRIVVADIAPRAYAPRHRQIFNGLLAIEPARYETREAIQNALAPFIPEIETRRFLIKNLERSPGGGFEWRIGLREIHSNYSRLGEEVAAGATYPGPALFLRGEYSDFLAPADLPQIRRRFPRADLQTIPGARHLLHTENPEAFERAVVEFLSV